jgi:hypothetical protein
MLSIIAKSTVSDILEYSGNVNMIVFGGNVEWMILIMMGMPMEVSDSITNSAL